MDSCAELNSLMHANVSSGFMFIGPRDELPSEGRLGDVCTLPDGSIYVYVGGEITWDIISDGKDDSATQIPKMVSRTTCEHCNASLDLFNINLNGSGVVRCSYCGGYTRVYE